MKYKQALKSILALAPLTLILTGCPTFSLISPSFTYNNNYNNSDNPNLISCREGGWFSSPYCSIPISKFITITAKYADPFPENPLITYDLKYGSFVFSDINQTDTIKRLNQEFLANYPDINKYATLPDPLQKLYSKIKEVYIPQDNYKKLMNAYIYLYTISALHLATSPCPTPDNGPTKLVVESLNYQQQYVLYRAFSIQYANYILYHLSNSLDSKYNNEQDLFNHTYQKILELNPYRLTRLAQELYDRTTVYLPSNESDFYRRELNFGELGYFSCNKYGTTWRRFGFEYFGTVVSGEPRKVRFVNRDVFKHMDGSVFNLGESLD